MLAEEEWAPIAGFERYFISSHGRIKNYLHRKPFYMKLQSDKGGYLRITLRGKKQVKLSIHRLVAKYFIRPSSPDEIVCHLDGDPKNNHVENLAYGSYKLNTSHRRVHDTDIRGEKHYCAKLKEADISKIRKIYKKYSKMSGGRALASKYNVSETTISRIIRRIVWDACA